MCRRTNRRAKQGAEITMGKKKHYQIKITRKETVEYFYTISASSENEAKQIALSGEADHGHHEIIDTKVIEVGVTK